MEKKIFVFCDSELRYDMDKISRIKKIVESALDTSFGRSISINEIVILPTQKFDEETNKWVPDSHTIFLTIKKIDDPKLNTSTSVTNLLEGLLGIEVCVDVL